MTIRWLRPALLLATATATGWLVCAELASASILKAEAVLPPGQSGYVSIGGVAAGTGSPHLSDQTDLFLNFQYKPFTFNQPGSATSPRPGVSITRDAYGVPRIDAGSDLDGWWGVGYAVAEDRLFQLELFRRAGSGRLSEILGSTYLDDDLIARRDYYTPTELDAQLAKLPTPLLDRLEAYRDGVNAYVDYLTTHPSEIPGEFGALGIAPSAIDDRDIARIGVLLARTVPSGDGNELENAQALAQIGPRAFNTMLPVRSRKRLVTIHRSEGIFPSRPGRDRQDVKAGFRRSQRFLDTIDLDAVGPGTSPRVVPRRSTLAQASAAEGEAPGADLARIIPHGGSYMWAIRDDRRGRTYLFNGPQLGFSIPELFVEFELHTPQQNLRGVGAAGVPLVGIGHNKHLAWGFTSGLSDEDDLFAARLVGGEESYTYRGQVRSMDCRDETFDYSTPLTSLPGLTDDPGLPSGSTTERICRTVHGPVQFRGNGVAYARDYAIWGRELETVVGISALNDARTVEQVDAALRKVTWNENVIAADDRGGIGYWHPGLHPLRAKRWDERLPMPGDGRADWAGLLPRSKTPHLVNPERNWLANWNNLPSSGWTNGDAPARERLNANLHRYRLLATLVRRVAKNPSYRRSRAIERVNGTTAQQFPFVNQTRLRRAKNRYAGPLAAKMLLHLRHWDGNYTRANAAGTVDPGVAIWEEFKDQLERIYLARFGPGAELLAGEPGTSHQFDISNGESLALRLTGARLYGRAADATATALAARFGSDSVVNWREPRRLYEISAQGAAAAPELPFFDRGTWTESISLGRRPRR